MNQANSEAPFGVQSETVAANQAVIQELGSEAVAASMEATRIPVADESAAVAIEVRVA